MSRCPYRVHDEGVGDNAGVDPDPEVEPIGIRAVEQRSRPGLTNTVGVVKVPTWWPYLETFVGLEPSKTVQSEVPDDITSRPQGAIYRQ
jgi:hypothetical protein